MNGYTRQAMAMSAWGGLSVAIFFLSSGYFVTKSMDNLRDFKCFFSKRVIRIIPPLIFVAFVCIIAGAWLSTLSFEEYFLNKETWKYILNGVLLLHKELPGVFLESPFSPVVNGSLWTLPLEFKCYIIIYICYELGFINKRKWWIGFGVMGLACVLTLPEAHVFPCILFLVGASYYVYRELIRYTVKIELLAAVLFVLFIILGQIKWGMIIFLPYMLFGICFSRHQVSHFWGKWGDFSYTIYLWGYPVQQTMSCLGIGVTPLWNSVLSIPIALILGVVTHYCVERVIIEKYEEKLRQKK